MKEYYVLVHSDDFLARDILDIIHQGRKTAAFGHLLTQCRVSYSDLLEYWEPTPKNKLPLTNTGWCKHSENGYTMLWNSRLGEVYFLQEV